jgi:major membrane immunogen (membrane-anchored lipoprotein)
MVGILPYARKTIAAALVALMPVTAGAQDAFKEFKQLDTTAKMPKLNAFIAPGSAPEGTKLHSVALEAKLTAAGDAVQDGLSWYVFSPVAGSDGKLPLIASSQGGSADFQLAPGDYFVNVSFGRAGVTRKLSVPEEGAVEKQTMVLEAGGLLLNAVSGSDVRIRPNQLSFSIYSADVRDDGERGLVMADVPPNTVVRLNAGTYHVVSEYGDTNASVRADIQVEAGKLTEATIQHKAAQINFKLVSDKGGEAIADTAWSILTAAGDSVGESVSAFPTMVLAEGEYSAVARNKDKIYQRDFKVEAGKNTDVEVLMQDVQPEQGPAATTLQQLPPEQQGQAQSTQAQPQQPLPSFDQLQGGAAVGGEDTE